MPHLHAAHWMISSVVPVKSPLIRGRNFALNVLLKSGWSRMLTGQPGVW